MRDQLILFGEFLLLLGDLLTMGFFLLHAGDGQRVFALLRERLLAARQLLFELLVAHLLRDLRVAGLVDLKNFAAIRAFDFLHIAHLSIHLG